jgi:hypothetical protein
MTLRNPLSNLVGPWVDVRSFAPLETPRDGSAPWHEYIQAAVDYLIELTLEATPPGPVGTLGFPPGKYRIDQPIRITRTHNGVYAFCSINIVGDAPRSAVVRSTARRSSRATRTSPRSSFSSAGPSGSRTWPSPGRTRGRSNTR